jgi:hypothetical protein
MVSATPQPLYHREINPIHILKAAGWPLRPEYEESERFRPSPDRDSNLIPSSPWQVAIPTELSRPPDSKEVLIQYKSIALLLHQCAQFIRLVLQTFHQKLKQNLTPLQEPRNVKVVAFFVMFSTVQQTPVATSFVLQAGNVVPSVQLTAT